MLTQKEHKNWENFADEVSKSVHLRAVMPLGEKVPLYRGQSDSMWRLESALERYTKKKYTLPDYFSLVQGVVRMVESYAKEDWSEAYSDGDPHGVEVRPLDLPPGIEFMIHIRHLGFPSPLVDWTRSPYVAAYFAFRDVKPTETPFAAVYSFIDHHDSVSGELPYIYRVGPCVKTHPRHYIQQAQYTICRKKDAGNDYYWSHEDALAQDSQNQKECVKHIIPSSEKEKVLDLLHSMNITDYSLFGTEESLMRTMAFQEIGEKKDFS